MTAKHVHLRTPRARLRPETFARLHYGAEQASTSGHAQCIGGDACGLHDARSCSNQHLRNLAPVDLATVNMTLKRLFRLSHARGGALVAAVALASVGLGLLSSDHVSAATVGASDGLLTPSADALKVYHFDDGAELIEAKAQLAALGGAFGYPSIKFEPLADTKTADKLIEHTDALEGRGSLIVGRSGNGLALMDTEFFATLAERRIRISAWVRAEGATVPLRVFYGKPEWPLATGTTPDLAQVVAIRTGRETTDGWVEYSTGPIDGSVWGAPIHAIMLVPRQGEEGDKIARVDALEILPEQGQPTQPTACTQATVDTACGAGGDCMFGHCVDSTVTWGVLPGVEHRREIAGRWSHYAKHLMGDRQATKTGADTFAPAAAALAENAVSSRQFFEGMNALVGSLRDNHTSFGSPPSYSSFLYPLLVYPTSSGLGACFGLVEKDLLGGGQGFGVFKSMASPKTGVALLPGDVVTEIDGQDAVAWALEQSARFNRTQPNDPNARLSPLAAGLSALLSTRATNVKLVRCTPATDCQGANQQVIDVNVADPIFQYLSSGEVYAQGASDFMYCSPRFHDSVATLKSGSQGEDPISTAPGPVGETNVQFDGFSGRTQWENDMSAVFAGSPARVLMDTRQGNGGVYTTVKHLFDLLRGTSEPMGVYSVGRSSYDSPDSPTLLDDRASCIDANAQQFSGPCWIGNANGFLGSVPAPPGMTSKIAWLNSNDVSANDFMPRLLKGRSNFRIFAPHPTAGAFGAVNRVPAIMATWSGGSIQVQDARFGSSLDEMKAARWESGHGVEPDEIVAQKLSDILADKDTMLDAARAWLAQP